MNASKFVLAMGVGLVLAACGRAEDSRTAGQKLDAAVATAQVKGSELKQDAKEGMANVRETTRNVADIGREKAVEAGDAVKDASITASVKAELARDPDLSAIAINVDTAGGKVILRGTAPTASARERATMLAGGVTHVVSVDNQLAIGANNGTAAPDASTATPTSK